MTPSVTAAKRTRRFPRPQFSLRVLILLLTAFAIGFPIWYRWPYQETQVLDGGASSRTATWQRQWGGSRLQHGPQTANFWSKVDQTATYRHGILHGPWTEKMGNRYEQRGQYQDGEREGTWTARIDTRTVTRHYLKGRLHGANEFDNVNGQPLVAHFEHGRLTHLNDMPVDDAAINRFKRRNLDARLANELSRETQLDVVQMPLKDVALFLSDRHGLPVAVDAKHVQADRPVTADLRGLDFQSMLAILASSQGLAWDYRYGCLWITTPEQAAADNEPTGVEKLQPEEESALARVWNEPISIDVINKPLTTVLADLEQRLLFRIDTTRIARSEFQSRQFRVTENLPGFSSNSLPGIPFRHALGWLLYDTGCRCELDGDKLIILPPEN
jgi:hypothetical protein